MILRIPAGNSVIAQRPPTSTKDQQFIRHASESDLQGGNSQPQHSGIGSNNNTGNRNKSLTGLSHSTAFPCSIHSWVNPRLCPMAE